MVVITGASSGIGEACARVFAAARFDLVLVARRADKLQALAKELAAQHGVKVHAYGLDVQSYAAVSELVTREAKVFGAAKVLINNAGLAKGLDTLQDGKPEDWDAMIDTNVKGLLYVTRALLPGMIQRGEGHVVNLGSVAGQWVYPKGNVYCATKFAVRALTEGLRQDVHGTGVRVTEIAPGMVVTDFSKVRFNGDAAKADAVYAGVDALTPTDIAESILWCVQRPKRVNIQELTIFPTAQSAVQMIKRDA